MRQYVFCTLQVEGTHNWPNCPFDEVAYLRVEHRHMFHIKAVKTVSHSDRDTEFIMLKHQISEYFATHPAFCKSHKLVRFGRKSCEDIAQELIVAFDLAWAEVSEDGESGSIVYAE